MTHDGDGDWRPLSFWKVGVALMEGGQRVVSFESKFVEPIEGIEMPEYVLLDSAAARDFADQVEATNLSQLVGLAKALRITAATAELRIFAAPARKM